MCAPENSTVSGQLEIPGLLLASQSKPKLAVIIYGTCDRSRGDRCIVDTGWKRYWYGNGRRAVLVSRPVLHSAMGFSRARLHDVMSLCGLELSMGEVGLAPVSKTDVASYGQLQTGLSVKNFSNGGKSESPVVDLSRN